MSNAHTCQSHKYFFKDMASYSVTAWGMSETSPIGLMSRIDKIAVGSCGVVVPNTECKIGKTKNLVKLKTKKWFCSKI